MQNHVVGGDEGERRGDHFVSFGPSAVFLQELERQMQSGRAGVYKMGVWKSRVAHPGRSELQCLFAGTRPSSLQAVPNFSECLFCSKFRSKEVNRFHHAPV